MAHYETWFKLLWNECVNAIDESPDLAESKDHPLWGMVETMHGIAEDQPDMWLQVPDGSPILRMYSEHEIPPGHINNELPEPRPDGP